MQTLINLYKNHTGKVSDKWSSYLTEYDRLFSPYREQNISILEIGVQNGGSLEIWSQYFPNANIFVGCDINPNCGNLSFKDARIKVVVGDATKVDVMAKILAHSAQFDLIIEDGSHISSDIVKAFALYFPALKNGGLFVAEDLHCSYWQEFEGGIYQPYSALSFFKHLIDMINHEHWGVEKTRAKLITGFKELHNIELSESLLAEISSVEFVNSVCIIRKNNCNLNGLGDRVVAGISEQVVSGHLPLLGTKLQGLDQSSNAWSTLSKAPAESYQQLCADLQTQPPEVEHLNHQLTAIQNSRSWRYFMVLRKLFTFARNPVKLFRLVKIHSKLCGSHAQLALKVLRIAQKEGLPGIRVRFSMVYRNDYQEWIKHYDTFDGRAIKRMKTEITCFKAMPKISVVMPVYNAPLKFLKEAIESVQAQIYPNWELCIADDASTDQEIRPILKAFAESDERIKVVFRAENGHISAASNSALELASGEFVALLDNDDLLPAHALYYVAKTINVNPEAVLIYSDEDKINQAGLRYGHYFKSEFNYELLLAQNMFSHFGVFRRSYVTQVGGFRVGFEGSQDYDLVLRILEVIKTVQVKHIPKVLYHWRAIPGSTALNPSQKNYATDAARRAIKEHLQRTGRDGTVQPAPEVPNFTRVRYQLPLVLPLVSIIIPTRDRADLLNVCLDSILKKTTYPNFEIVIVDNGSEEKATQQLFENLPKNKVTVLRDDGPFNYSALNNAAVLKSKGEVVCLMNNDIEILTPDWIEEMLSFAIQVDVGCVGARLWYPDGRLQHGGVILGIGGGAGHSHKYLNKGAHGYVGRGVLHQSLSAVTGACLMVRRALWDEVGGLDEDFAVAFNDVDFCLRVRARGYRNIWTPYAEMNHHEYASRGFETTPEKQARFASEVKRLQERWAENIKADVAYSPNLSLVYDDFSLAWPPRLQSLYQ